ncbi:MAG: alpha/beta hydrolase fold domain-containing protein [Coriobacteriales bacterium]|jgi:acetyl esterase/lipase
MGFIYEVISTPPAYLKKAIVNTERVKRSSGPIGIPFGPHKLQHCVLWEPDVVKHETVVMYFHGGGYLVGDPESMIDAANVYTYMGYRFCSVGFRLMPKDPFPAQVDDAFNGIKAAIEWLESNGRPASKIVIGGSSCGGHLSTLVGYGTELQRAHDFPSNRLVGIISVAAITDVDDMLLRPFPTPIWHQFVDLPTEAPDREHMHRALLDYSPIALLDKIPAGSQVPPFFAIHGISDKMSPYNHELDFVRKLNRRFGDGTARLHTVWDPRWQHMTTTVTLHKDSVESSAPLSELFAWLDELDGTNVSS